MTQDPNPWLAFGNFRPLNQAPATQAPEKQAPENQTRLRETAPVPTEPGARWSPQPRGNEG